METASRTTVFAFLPGRIYRTQGGEFRRLADEMLMIDNEPCAVASHVNSHSGRSVAEGGPRRMTDGKFPRYSHLPDHRSHLVPGEWEHDPAAGYMRLAGAGMTSAAIAAHTHNVRDPGHSHYYAAHQGGLDYAVPADPSKPQGPAIAQSATFDYAVVDAEIERTPKAADAATAAAASATETVDHAARMKDSDAAGQRRTLDLQLAKRLPLATPAVKPNPFARSPDLTRSSHQVDPGHGSALIRLGLV